ALVGALALVWLVLIPVDKQPDAQSARQQQRLRQRMLRWAATCAAAALVVGIGMLFWQVASFQTLATVQTSWLVQARLVLLETQWGVLWLTRQGLLIFLGGGLLLLASRSAVARSSWLQLLVFGRAIDLMIVQALAGHATSESHNWLLALTSATLHLLAAGAWIGGLIALVVIVLPARAQHKSAAEQWRPLSWRAFSLLAALSVALLIATGLFNMGRQVASIDALMDSAYGRFLLGKLGLVLFIGLCGIVNTCLLHPKLARGMGRLLGRSTQPQLVRRSFPPVRLIALEAVLGVLLFGITGFITATSPPRDVAYTIAPAQIQKSLTQRVDDLLITLEVSPNRLGQNLINIRAVNPARPMSADILQLYVQLTPVRQTAEPITILAEKIDTDQFQVIGNHLTLAGPWRIDMRIQRYGRPDLTTRFEWMVPPAGELQPVRISKAPLAPLLNRLVIGFLIGLVLTSGGWRWFIQRQNRLRPPQNADMKSDLLAPTLPAA
ncbi:MAG: CopD family protein, partial [Caldilineaceae bacterium]|nr:CopD family protein [Caldilineaceae bacterium]